jgi:hypothetical protein
MTLHARNSTWLQCIQERDGAHAPDFQVDSELPDHPQDPKLFVIPNTENTSRVVLRQVELFIIIRLIPPFHYYQAGDSAILVEYGEMTLDFTLRARIHAFETILKQRNIAGILAFCPCVRSTMVIFSSAFSKARALI